MWPFKKKQEQQEEETIVEVKKEPTLAEILDNPWYIGAYDGWYRVFVYRFDTSGLDKIEDCVKEMVGIESKEFYRMCKEIFGKDNISAYNHATRVTNLVFKNKEDAEKIVREFRPYYDTYHIPRAVAERLTCYDEANGGYPAPMYLKERASTPGPAYLKAVK